MRALRKNHAAMITISGAFLMATSILWEYVRTAPDFGFIMRPWSIRGYETTQGLVILAISLAVMLIVTLLALELIPVTRVARSGFAAATVLFAVVVAIVADPREIIVGWIGVVGIGSIAALLTSALLKRIMPDSWSPMARTSARLGSFIVVVTLGAIVLGQWFASEEQPVWLVLLITIALLHAYATINLPTELGQHRILINMVIATLVIAITMAVSLRVELAELQVIDTGVAADIRFLQVTSGVFWLWVGGLIAFSGSSAMWARKRDEMRLARRRALAIAEAQAKGTPVGTAH